MLRRHLALCDALCHSWSYFLLTKPSKGTCVFYVGEDNLRRIEMTWVTLCKLLSQWWGLRAKPDLSPRAGPSPLCCLVCDWASAGSVHLPLSLDARWLCFLGPLTPAAAHPPHCWPLVPTMLAVHPCCWEAILILSHPSWTPNRLLRKRLQDKFITIFY